VEVPGKPTAANLKGVYLGRWKDIPVVVKLMADWYPPEFRDFDEFVCLKATGETGCTVSRAILSDYIHQDKDLLLPDRLLSAWKISYNHTGPLALTYGVYSSVYLRFILPIGGADLWFRGLAIECEVSL